MKYVQVLYAEDLFVVRDILPCVPCLTLNSFCRATNTTTTGRSSRYGTSGTFVIFVTGDTCSGAIPPSHGLSYTTFELSELSISDAQVANNDVAVTASVKVTNTGSVTGTEVVQLYVTLPATSELTHPPLQLKAFAKVIDLAPGKSEFAKLTLDKYAVSYWEERIARWVVESGVYRVRVGNSSAPQALKLSSEFKIKQGFEWNGL